MPYRDKAKDAACKRAWNNKNRHRYSFPERNAYSNASIRCNNVSCKDYKNYGGRGIKFLFTSYAEFLAEVGPRPSKSHSLDRKNVNGHYEKGNVRWATRKEQLTNRRKIKCLQNFEDEELLAELQRRGL